MNIVQLQDMLKSMPDNRLQQELSTPTGSVPQYLVLSEVVRRDKIRSEAASKPTTTVAQDLAQKLLPQPPQAFAGGGFISASESMGNAGFSGYPTQQPKTPNPISANTGITSMFAPSPAPKPAAPQTVNNVQVSQPQPKFDDGQSNNFDSPSYYEQGAYANGGLASFAGGGMSGDLPFFIKREADRLGIDPVDLATAISYETGGTFDPAAKGPKTKWGRHIGLIQMGEPQRKQYGYDPNGSLDSQMSAVGNYLADRGVKPGMKLLDVYSTINAGAPGLYNRSDEKAGGAPGTVLDKVRDQMAGHKEKAMNLFGLFPQAVTDLVYGKPLGAGQGAAGFEARAENVPSPDMATRSGGIMDMIGLKAGTPGADQRLADMKSLGLNMMQQKKKPMQIPDMRMAPADLSGLSRMKSDPNEIASAMLNYGQYMGAMASGGAVRMADGDYVPLGVNQNPSYTPESILPDWLKEGWMTGQQAQEYRKKIEQSKPDPETKASVDEAIKQYQLYPQTRAAVNRQRGPLGPSGESTGHMTPDEAALSAARSKPSQYQLSMGMLERSDKRQQEYLDKLVEMQRRQMEEATGGKSFLRQLGLGMLMNPTSLQESIASGAQNAIQSREAAQSEGTNKLDQYDLAKMKLASDMEAEKAKLEMSNMYPEGLTTQQQAQYLFGKIVELRNKAADDPTKEADVKLYDSVIRNMMTKFGIPALSNENSGLTDYFNAVVK